jgi:hypothetical protein
MVYYKIPIITGYKITQRRQKWKMEEQKAEGTKIEQIIKWWT